MPIELDIRGDVKELARDIKWRRDQIPFATAVAITRTAKKIQEASKLKAQTTFDYRNDGTQGFFLRSIRVQTATKARLTARVYTEVPFSKKQQKGGAYSISKWVSDKLGVTARVPPGFSGSGKRIPIPLDATAEAMRRPWAIKKGFVIVTQSSEAFIFQRVKKARKTAGKKARGERLGGGRKRDKDAGIVARFYLGRAVSVSVAWSINPIQPEMVRMIFRAEFSEALTMALKTAGRPSG